MCNVPNGQADQNTADDKTVATDTSLHHALGLDRELERRSAVCTYPQRARIVVTRVIRGLGLGSFEHVWWLVVGDGCNCAVLARPREITR